MVSKTLRLPTAGETVICDGLVSKPELNGKRGKILRYDEELRRYPVRLRLDDGTKKVLCVKPQNVTLVPSRKNDAGSSVRGNDAFYYTGDWDTTHVFVPCHLESRHRCEQFRQCLLSLVHQAGRCRVFVSISGDPELRLLAMDSLRFGAAMPERGPGGRPLGQHHQWIVLVDENSDEYTNRAQFEHHRDMLNASLKIKANAWLLFLDNDDLYHRLRVRWCQDVIAKRRGKTNTVQNSFWVGSKLLIDVAKTNDKFGEGYVIKYDQFASLDDALTDLVKVASTPGECNEMDVQEYFDFCVKSEVLRAFFDATPDGIVRNRFCDVRLCGSLTHQRIVTYVHPAQEWLLMHHRVGGDDRHQLAVDADVNRYTNALLRVEVSDEDRRLAERTGMNPAKVALLRRDIEECAIQAVHRDDANVAFYRNRLVPIYDKQYNNNIGSLLWDEVMSNLESCYTEEQAAKSREWWVQCGIQPPPLEDEAHTDDRSKYF